MATVSTTVDGVEVETTSAHSGTVEELTASLTAPPEPAETSRAVEPPAGEPAVVSGAKTEAAAPAATTEPAEPDPASEAGKQLSKRRRDMQAAIDQATWEKHEARREADRLKAELEALKQPVKPAIANDGRPTLKSFIERIGTDFDDYESAVEAHADALTDFKISAVARASNAAQMTQARDHALTSITARGQAEHPDFDAVLGQFAAEGGRLAPSNAAEAQGPLGDLEQVILTHPKGHAVAYAVAKDPELRAQLLGATTRVAFMETMGELLIRLKGAPTGSPSSPAPVSKAKPPVQPAKGQPQATGGPPGDDASDEEHLAYYNQQERAARRRA